MTPDPSTPLDLEAIERVANAATPGPWRPESVVSDHEHDICLDYDVPGEGSPIMLATMFSDECTPAFISVKQGRANATFVASARQWVPRLVEEIKELRDTEAWARAALKNAGLQKQDVLGVSAIHDDIVALDLIGRASSHALATAHETIRVLREHSERLLGLIDAQYLRANGDGGCVKHAVSSLRSALASTGGDK
jgi:hypothetical protein